MKKFIYILFILSIIVPFQGNAQTKSSNKNPEYMVLWVTHILKQTGMESRLEVNIGNMNGHSLKGIVSNGESGTVVFNDDGKTTVVRTEVDFLTVASFYGFYLYNVEVTDVAGKKYFQYLLIKETE